MYRIVLEALQVSLYIKKYHRLPRFYITKQAAARLGWEGGSLDSVLPGMAIGGDAYHNRSGALPKSLYWECDLGTRGSRTRGACRLVFSKTNFFLTLDHYQTFIQIHV